MQLRGALADPAVEGEIVKAPEQAQGLADRVGPKPREREQAGAQRIGGDRRIAELFGGQRPAGKAGRQRVAVRRSIAGPNLGAPKLLGLLGAQPRAGERPRPAWT